MSGNLRAICFSLSIILLLATDAHAVELSSRYPFQKVLFDDQGQFYGLYWNYSIAAGTIHFAVNVSTTGWVGFGVSPNGQMPGSDVVIGWVADDGKTYFHDRYAEMRALPPIDASQDWFLTFGEEEDGYTILEFYRNLTTCDTHDLDISTATARIVWSFNANDPLGSTGNTAEVHDYKGSLSLNLLGGLRNPPPAPDDMQSFDLVVSNVTIPSADTTYWCQGFELPEEVRNATKYITKISPVITHHARDFVHHILIYACTTPLNESSLSESGPCDTQPADVQYCQSGLIIGGWAVGGEDIVFPENAALPIGGPSGKHYAVIEMHYDNPNFRAGVVDSSGIRFYYSSSPREHDAGILTVGHRVTSYMIIPPGTHSYTIGAVCTGTCTNNYLPDGGLHIFGNLLHTHLAGRALELQHLRWNSECGVYEELPPIDFNPNYDFNFQQFTYLPKEVTVLPGDVLILKCYYDTTSSSNVTVGGQSTREEMCLSFPLYYPYLSEEQNLDYCLSQPNSEAYNSFISHYSPLNPEASALFDDDLLVDGLNAIAWTPEERRYLEDSILNGPIATLCLSATPDDNETFEIVDGLPQVSCPYQAPDQCNCFEPQSCCERLAAGDNAVKPTGCPATGTSRGVAVAVPHGVYVVITSLVMLWSTILDAARL